MKKNILNKLETFKLIYNFLNNKRKGQIILLQILTLFCAISEFLNLIFVRFYLNTLIDKNQIRVFGFFSEFFKSLPEKDFQLLISIFVLITIFISSFLRIIVIKYQFKVSALISLDIGSKIYNSVINKPYIWHVENSSSNILGLLTNDIEKVRDLIKSFLSFQINLLLIIFISTPLFLIQPKFMSFSFLIIIVLFFTIYRSSRSSLKEDGLSITNSYQNGLQLISDSLGSIKNILIDYSQKYFLDNYKNKFQEYHISFGLVQTKFQTPRFIVEGLFFGLIILISIFFNLSKAKYEIQFSTIGTISLGIYKLLVPFQQCSLAVSMLKAYSASLEKIKPYLREIIPSNEFLKEKKFQINNNEEIPLICLDNVNFKYPKDKRFILKDFNLKINKGQKVAFIGYSGAGKTTCGNLIAGLLKPNYGNILINGKNIISSKYDLRKWHDSFAYVPQNIFVLQDTILKNIAFGVPEEKIDLERAIYASQKACLHKTVIKLRNKYQERIGENGKKLSGGQKQRLSIARTFYKKAKCIIFDEATNQLDNELENELINSLNIPGDDLTMIFITHRLNFIKSCDLIVFFEEKGKYSIGKYDDLLSQNAQFERFLNNKFLDN